MRMAFLVCKSLRSRYRHLQHLRLRSAVTMTPRFQTALTAWLDEDDQTSLPELAALAAEDNSAAQVLLGLVDRAPPLQGPWLANLPRSERIALIRAPGGLSGRSWMISAVGRHTARAAWVTATDARREPGDGAPLRRHG